MTALSKMTHDELKQEAAKQVFRQRKLSKEQWHDTTAQEEAALRRAWSVMKRLPAGTRVDLNEVLRIGKDHYKGERDLVLIDGILYQELREDGYLWQEYPIVEYKAWLKPSEVKK